MDTSELKLKYVLVGSSGAGKTTMAGILKNVLGFQRCITSTTRPPRPGEVDGIDYHFRSSLHLDEMFEMARFGENLYGTTWDELMKGDFIILEPQGVRYFREHYPAPLCVIQLQRDNIQVDAERMDRDRSAAFDSVDPDIVVTGNTIDAMASNLLSAIAQYQQKEKRQLSQIICSAEDQKQSRPLEIQKQDKEYSPTR